MEKNVTFKWHTIYKDNCSKNLPEKEDTYLVSVIYGEEGNLQTNSYTCYFNASESKWEAIDSDIVVAWAPIPDPYIGDVNLSSLSK